MLREISYVQWSKPHTTNTDNSYPIKFSVVYEVLTTNAINNSASTTIISITTSTFRTWNKNSSSFAYYAYFLGK